MVDGLVCSQENTMQCLACSVERAEGCGTDPRDHTCERGIAEDTPAWDIVEECLRVRDMLLAKNRAYGNSALEPVRVFSKTDTIEQIKVRLDDKLSRLARGTGEETEDVELDILGYLVLLRIAKRRAA